MRSVRRLLILSVLATSAVAACSGDSTTDPFAPMALELSLSPAVDTILVLDSIPTTAPKKLALAASSLGHGIQTPSGVEWTSSDPNVADVDSTGTVRPRSIGSTSETTRYDEGSGRTPIRTHPPGTRSSSRRRERSSSRH